MFNTINKIWDSEVSVTWCTHSSRVRSMDRSLFHEKNAPKIASFFVPLPKRVKISEETVSDDGAVTLETSCRAAATGKLPQQKKHKTGYSAVWERQQSWVFNIEGHGMYCKLCQKFDTKNRPNQSRVWNKEPCTTIRKDVLMRHEASMMHKEALEQECACQCCTDNRIGYRLSADIGISVLYRNR